MWHVEDALLFASLPCCGVNLPIIGIAQVDEPTAFLWNARSQRHRDARRFNATCGVVGTRSLDVCAMGQNAARDILKAVPLLEEIIPYMVTDFVDKFAVRVGALGAMRGVDDDFASVGT